MTTYTITRRDEETECSYCAMPLFIEDKVYMSDDERDVFCSKSCAGFDQREQAQMIKRQPVGVRVGCFDV